MKITSNSSPLFSRQNRKPSSSPMTNRAVDRPSHSRQESATTVTPASPLRAGLAVAGSMMWQ